MTKLPPYTDTGYAPGEEDDLDMGRTVVPSDSGAGSHHSGRLETPRPGPTEVDGLIERLLTWADYGLLPNQTDKKTLREAAAALDGMRRENKTLRNTVHVQKGGYQNMLAETKAALAAAEKQNAELREALETLLRYSWPDNGGPADLAIKDARSLLKGGRDG